MLRYSNGSVAGPDSGSVSFDFVRFYLWCVGVWATSGGGMQFVTVGGELHVKLPARRRSTQAGLGLGRFGRSQ